MKISNLQQLLPLLWLASVYQFSSPALAEPTSDHYVEYPEVWAVKVTGNEITNEELILREMELKPGTRITPDLMASDRLRLLSIGIFNQVEISIVSDLGRAVVLVKVTERFYIYPYPIFRYDPARPERQVFGLTISHYNFRGNAERLSGGWWDGYERGFYLLHRDPWFSFRGIFGLRSQYFKNDIEIVAPDGNTTRAKIESFLLRGRMRLGKLRWIGLEAEWEERYSSSDFYTLSSRDRDRLLVGRIYYEADLRDYIYYPTIGYYFSAILKFNRMIDTTHSFFRQEADFRIYRTYGRFIFATRATGQISQNKLPYYRLITLTQNDIRSDSPVDRLGTTSLATNFEIRSNIYPLHYFSFPKIPFAGKYLQKLKFSVEGVTFADWGMIDIEGTRYNMGAYGLGLQFQLPYVEVARVTVGWGPKNPNDSPLIIFATGVTF